MMDFPTLSRQPLKGLTTAANNSGDLRHADDAGYITTRRRYTRQPAIFTFALQALTAADYVLLRDFVAAVSTVAAFNWTNPVDEQVYEVRFKSLPALVSRSPYHSTQIELEEV